MRSRLGMRSCRCGAAIPVQREELGFSTCVECSSARKYGVVPSLSHKMTGQAVIVKDPDDAARINKKVARCGYGVQRGMRY